MGGPIFGKRQRERLRLRWVAGATDAWSILGVHNWMVAVQDHDNWRSLLQVKAWQQVVVPFFN